MDDAPLTEAKPLPGKRNGAGMPERSLPDLPRFRPWLEMAVLALVGMEAAWVALWFRILSQKAASISYGRALAVLGGMLVAAYALAHLLNRLRLRQNLRRGLLAGFLIAGVLLGANLLLYPGQAMSAAALLRRTIQAFASPDGAIPSEFILGLALVWSWWRGVSLAGREVDTVTIRRGFTLGAGMLFAYGLIAPVTGETIIAPLYLFLFFWLSAMSAARLDWLSHHGGGQAAAFDRKWLGGILAAVLAVVGAAALAGSLMDWKLAAWIAFALGGLVRLILLAAALLMIPLVWLLGLLMPFLQKWLTNLPQLVNVVTDAMRQLAGMFDQLPRTPPERAFSLPPLIRPLLLWGVLLLAALGVIWVLRRRFLKSSLERRETPESLLSSGELLRLLLAAFRNRAQSLAGQIGEQGLGGAGRMLAAARIRRIYAQLMDLSAALGKSRPPACTPLEFLPILDRIFPNQSSEIQQITRSYLRVRYGELPETRQEVEAVETAWKRVREQGRILQDYERMKKAPKGSS